MRNGHLTPEELDLAALGGEPEGAAREHLAGCLACRRAADELGELLAEVRGADPDLETRARVREAALDAWQAPAAFRGRAVARSWWLAAAAAVLAAASLPLLRGPGAPPVDPAAVLEEVDRLLAEDPVAALAGEDVVSVVVPQTGAAGGSRS